MNIRRIFAITLAAVSILGAGACQKTYQMVPPPTAEEQDDLDDEDFWGSDDNMIFVSPYGDGDMDGSSWDNALDADAFISMLSDQTDLSKTTVCVSEGVYYVSGGSVFGPVVNKNIGSVKGGYSQFSTGTDLSKHDPAIFVTVLSGDINKSGKADEGDCGLMTVSGGHSSFEGITFRHGYVNETTASAKKSGSGIYVAGDADTWAEFVDCRFEDCFNAATNSGYAGGGAAYVVSGQARFKGCEFSGCSGTSRGGAIRGNANTAVIFLDRCSIHGNHVGSVWGSGIQLSSGTVCMNNTTICGNTAGNPAQAGELNGGGAMLVLNSTIISDDNTAAIRCESDPARGSVIANSIAVNVNSKPGFLLNGDSKKATSGGHNIFNSVSGNSFAASPSDVTAFVGGQLTDGVYVWNPDDVALSGYATASELEGYARDFNPDICAGIGVVFADWCDGFSVDQRGEERNPSKLLPGAYDPKLDGTATSAIRFSASARPFASVPSFSSFGLILTNSAVAGYSYSKEMILKDGEWQSSDGEMMFWDGRGTSVSVMAYAPYSAVSGTSVDVVCPAIQGSEASLAAADFVLCKEMVNPETDLKDGKIQLNMKHLNARVVVKVTVDGTPATPSQLTSLSLAGLRNSGVCDFSAAAPAVAATGSSVTMTPFAGADNYELLTVPQYVETGAFSVRMGWNKRQWVWTNSSAFTLEAGKTAELTVNISNTKSSTAEDISIIIR